MSQVAPAWGLLAMPALVHAPFQNALSTLRPEEGPTKGSQPPSRLNLPTEWLVCGRPDSPLLKHTHWVTSEQAAAPWGSSNLITFSKGVSMFVFSLVNVINRLDYLEKPNGNKKKSCIRNVSWLNWIVLVLAYSRGHPVGMYMFLCVCVCVCPHRWTHVCLHVLLEREVVPGPSPWALLSFCLSYRPVSCCLSTPPLGVMVMCLCWVNRIW